MDSQCQFSEKKPKEKSIPVKKLKQKKSKIMENPEESTSGHLNNPKLYEPKISSDQQNSSNISFDSSNVNNISDTNNNVTVSTNNNVKSSKVVSNANNSNIKKEKTNANSSKNAKNSMTPKNTNKINNNSNPKSTANKSTTIQKTSSKPDNESSELSIVEFYKKERG